ncbi:MAG: hypothetical protein ACE5HE_03560, partial [Phycisphaerae bacterium]
RLDKGCFIDGLEQPSTHNSTVQPAVALCLLDVPCARLLLLAPKCIPAGRPLCQRSPHATP